MNLPYSTINFIRLTYRSICKDTHKIILYQKRYRPCEAAGAREELADALVHVMTHDLTVEEFAALGHIRVDQINDTWCCRIIMGRHGLGPNTADEREDFSRTLYTDLTIESTALKVEGVPIDDAGFLQ